MFAFIPECEYCIHQLHFTYCQILSLPELEDVPIEDWHEYEHVEGDPICKNPGGI